MTDAAVAFHEAGHAVMAWYLGRRFRSVSIVPRSGSRGRVWFCEPLSGWGRECVPAPSEEAVMIYLAGPLAAWPLERRFRAMSSIVDLTHAERLVARWAGPGADGAECLARLRERAWNVLGRDDLWRGVTVLARCLVRRKRITGSMARRIIANAC